MLYRHRWTAVLYFPACCPYSQFSFHPYIRSLMNTTLERTVLRHAEWRHLHPAMRAILLRLHCWPIYLYVILAQAKMDWPTDISTFKIDKILVYFFFSTVFCSTFLTFGHFGQSAWAKLEIWWYWYCATVRSINPRACTHHSVCVWMWILFPYPLNKSYLRLRQWLKNSDFVSIT